MRTEKEIREEKARLNNRKRMNKFREKEMDYFIAQIKEDTLKWVLKD